ncbi:CFEM domain-containing protein [Xylogone sp. PMI_703]|nr:CFEM domain-containing protein [Xylogone sp. PMI_703]
MASQNISQGGDRNALIITLVLSCVFVFVRGIARYRKTGTFPHAIEDLFLFLALASYIGLVGIYLYCLPILFRSEAIGAGKEQVYPGFDHDMKGMLHGFLAAQLIFWLALWSVKLSLLFMFRKLTIGLPDYRYIWAGIMVFTLLSFVGCVISGFTSCSSLHAWFTAGACETARDAVAKKASLYYSLAVDLLTDLLIMSIPIRLLWTLRISALEKLSVGFAFSVGVITMVIAIIRVISLDNTTEDGEVNTSWLVLWAAIEVCVAIFVGCLPAFAIFVRSEVISSNRQTYYGPNGTSNAQERKRSHGRSESILLDDVDIHGREDFHDPGMTNIGGVSWTEVTAHGERS